MKTITTKNVPPDVHRQLKSRTRFHGRSLNREIVTVLKSKIRGTPIDAAAVGQPARAVRETMGVYLTELDLLRFKTAGR